MLFSFSAFCTICMAGHTFGKLLSPLNLPSITLFIFFGLACGPYGFDLITKDDQAVLGWINDLALGFIGLSAGGHFRVSEMMGSIGPALVVLGALVTITYSGTLAVLMTLMLLMLQGWT